MSYYRADVSYFNKNARVLKIAMSPTNPTFSQSNLKVKTDVGGHWGPLPLPSTLRESTA